MINELVHRHPRNPYLLSTPMYTDLGGGTNIKSYPTGLNLNQSLFAENVNFNSATGRFVAREGMRSLLALNFTSAPFAGGDLMAGLTHGQFTTGNKIIIAIHEVTSNDREVYYDNSGTWVNITGAIGGTLADYQRVRFVNFEDAVIGVDGTNTPFKITNLYAAVVLAGGPPTCKHAIAWNDYLFMAGDSTNDLYFSARGDEDTWPAANFQPIGSKQDPIIGLATVYGHLIIFKRHSIYAISGANADEFVLTEVTGFLGMAAEGCSVDVEGSAWFLSDKGMCRITPDLRVDDMSEWVRRAYQLIVSYSNTTTRYPVIAYNSRLNQVWLSCAADIYSPTDIRLSYYDRVMVHDLNNVDETGRPVIHHHIFGIDTLGTAPYSENFNPEFMAHYTASDGETCLMTWNRKQAYAHIMRDDGNTANGDGNVLIIHWYWNSRYFDLGDPTLKKKLRFYTLITTDSSSADYKMWIHGTDSFEKIGPAFRNLVRGRSTYFIPTLDARSSNVVLGTFLSKWFAFGFSGKVMSNSVILHDNNTGIAGFNVEYVLFGRRL